MKKTLFLTLYFFIFCLDLRGQGCLPDGITFNAQAEIDSFPIKYPGCTSIIGEVKIIGLNITNLAPLNKLKSVGNLVIEQIYALPDLSGLENLDTIRGNLEISLGFSLQSLNGLEGLKYIGSLLKINTCYLIKDLNGLNNIDAIKDGLLIGLNDSMTSFSGLEKIDRLTNLFISDVPLVTDLHGFENIKKIEYIEISRNNLLKNLNGLNHLTTIYRAVIYDNPSLMGLEGLEDLTMINSITANRNNSLSFCSIQAVCDRLEQNPEEVHISDNAIGCDTPTEVALQCDSLSDASVLYDQPLFWQIMGNPARNLLFIKSTEFIAGEKEFVLYSVSGKRVCSATFSGQIFEFQRDMLGSGIYFFRISDERGRVFTGKIILTE